MKVIFYLGMTYAQVKTTCPKSLIPVFIHSHGYYACDMGVATQVIAIENDRVMAVMDIKWFVDTIDKDPPRKK